MCSRVLISRLVAIMLNLTAMLHCTSAQDPVRVTERGPHHRTIVQRLSVTNELGDVFPVQSSFVELQTGMHYQAGGEWVEAEEKIEISPEGAEALRGQHQVKFGGNALGRGVIQLTMPDGQIMRSHVLGLSYYDAATGESVLIAEVKSSQGFLLPPNQVLYVDAFDDVKADIRYTYTKAGLEQDIILREQPPLPEKYGLNADSTRLEVLTEFTDAPAVSRKLAGYIRKESDQSRRQQMVEPDFVDEHLEFGTMSIGPGRAFPVAANNSPKANLRVGKYWLETEGRSILVEALDYRPLRKAVANLPVSTAAVSGKNKTMGRKLPQVAANRNGNTGRLLYALAGTKAEGYVIDYLVTLTSQTNYTFKGDTTYYVNAPVILSGTTTFEGGAVIKYTNSTASAYLRTDGPVFWDTDLYRPVVLTAKDDDTVGNRITGSTGNPTNYYGASSYGAITHNSTNSFAASNIIARCVYSPFSLQSGTIVNFRALKCFRAFAYNGNVSLKNALFQDFGTSSGFYAEGWNNQASIEHLTMDNVAILADAHEGTDHVVGVTNSIIMGYTNYLGDLTVFWGESTTFYTNNVLVGATNNPPFKKVGAGYYYLNQTNALVVDQGTTNISSDLRLMLARLTTEAPVVYSNSTSFLPWQVTTNTVWQPVVKRDTNTLDLGFHYPPIDYACQLVKVTNATLTLTNGVVVAAIGYGGGIYLDDAATLNSSGRPGAMNRIIRYNNVQEAGISWAPDYDSPYLVQIDTGAYPYPSITAEFTDLSAMNYKYGKIYSFVIWSDYQGYSLSLRHSEMFNTIFDYAANDGDSIVAQVGLTNCLFKRVDASFTDNSATLKVNAVNNSLIGGSWTFELGNGRPFSSVSNCVFEGAVVNAGSSPVTNSFNAYSGTNILAGSLGSNLTNQTFGFQTGPLGNYYLPPNSELINAGPTSATNVGLYHFTVLVSNVKETNTVVDIGYHYVALGENGEPADTDGDGWADYLEDANGNGISDGGEYSFLTPDHDRDGVADWQDGDPNDPNIGVLSITIDSPANGGVFQ